MNGRLDYRKRLPAAWMLLAALVWVSQPFGTSLFCHPDSSHDHGTHDQGTHTHGAQGHGSYGHTTHHHSAHSQTGPVSSGHHHTSAIGDNRSQTKTQASGERSGNHEESCCSQPNDNAASFVIATIYSFTSDKTDATQAVAVLLQVFRPERAPAVQSRAGPSVPTVVSQLRRCSLLDRAPPISA